MTEENVIVRVAEGKIRGFKTNSEYSGVEYYSFLGIPYGQSTAGSARFKDPVEVKPWNKVLNAVTEKNGCVQFSLSKKELPSVGDALKAVIVNFHSGGFFHGSPDPSDLGSPEYVIHHDFVYVCVAYRLHILDLYHKAILMGMYAFNPLAINLRKNASTAYEIARSLGYNGKPGEDKKLLKFFKKLNIALYFLSRNEYFFSETHLQVYPCSPCTFDAVPGENSPLPVSHEKLIPSTNRVPIIIGFCEKEAIFALGLLRLLQTPLTKSFRTCITQNKFGWGANLNEEELKTIQEEVENYYLAGNSIENASESDLCDILTDIALSDVYNSLINMISADLPSSVYVYNFFYDGKLCDLKAKLSRLLKKPLSGAFHAADYSYWNKMEGTNIVGITSKDQHNIDRFTRLITTFAKTSNPNYEGLEVEWKPTTPEHPSHLIFDDTLHVKDELLNGKRMEFWHELKTRFNKDRNNYLVEI